MFSLPRTRAFHTSTYTFALKGKRPISIEKCRASSFEKKEEVICRPVLLCRSK